MMTSPDIQSGTDRVAAVADQVPGDVFVNVQGDEPLMEASTIEARRDSLPPVDFQWATVMTRLKIDDELQ